MNFTPELIFQLLAMVLGGAMAYGAIRADLKTLHEKSSDNKESVENAHIRIDQHVRDHLLSERMRKGECDV